MFGWLERRRRDAIRRQVDDYLRLTSIVEAGNRATHRRCAEVTRDDFELPQQIEAARVLASRVARWTLRDANSAASPRSSTGKSVLVRDDAEL
jgi:hypothetical protein